MSYYKTPEVEEGEKKMLIRGGGATQGRRGGGAFKEDQRLSMHAG